MILWNLTARGGRMGYFRAKKKTRIRQVFYLFDLSILSRNLALRDRANRAAASASAAVYTYVRVDLELGIALRDRANRALRLAGTAADASGANYMCHEKHLLI